MKTTKAIVFIIILFQSMANIARSQNVPFVRIVYYGDQTKPVPAIYFSYEKTIRLDVNDGLPHKVLHFAIEQQSFMRFLTLVKRQKYRSKKYKNRNIYLITDNNGLKYILADNKISLFFSDILATVRAEKLDDNISKGLEELGYF